MQHYRIKFYALNVAANSPGFGFVCVRQDPQTGGSTEVMDVPAMGMCTATLISAAEKTTGGGGTVLYGAAHL